MPRNRNLVRIGSGLLLGAAALLGTGGCEIARPRLPHFTTTLTVPLGTQRVTAAEIAAHEAFLGIDADSLLAFSLAGGSDTVQVAAELAIDLPATSASATLGVFAPASGAPAVCDFPLRALCPAAALLDGQTVSVPPFAFDLAAEPCDLPGIVAASVASGRLEVTVVNGLPVPVSGEAAPERIVVALIDPDTDAVLANVVFAAPLPPGATATAATDLAGVALPDSVAVRLTGGSTGAAAPVTVAADARVRVTARLCDLGVVAATAVIGPQQLDTTAAVTLPDSVRVQEAQIVAGVLAVTVENTLAVPCRATLVFPELTDAHGQPVATSLDLAPRGSGSRELALGGATLRAPGAAPLTALSITIAVTSPGGGPAPVTLSAGDGLRAEVAPARLRFGSVTGVIPERRFALGPLAAAVDLPDDLSGVSLTAAALTLSVDNGSGVPARLAITLCGRAAGGGTATLLATAAVAAAVGGEPSRTDLVLDESNSDIVAFLNNLPVEITLTGTVGVGGDGTVGTVRPSDRAAIAWRLDAPLRVVVRRAVVRGTPQPLALDAEARGRLAGHLGAVRVVAEIANHLPLGVEIRLLAGDDPATLAAAPQLVVGPLTAAGGRLHPELLAVNATETTRSEVALTSAQAELLTRAGLHTLVEVTLPGSDGRPVALRASDWLTVKGCVAVDVDITDQE